tara:strand:+ start:792 stop:1199 length:408 start_codon:yes stop_codon:yes gene_type:complete
MDNYYEILKLKTSCENEDVKKNYKKLIKKLSSKFLSDEEKIKLKKIQSAFYVLSNYHRRRKYDNLVEGYIKKTEIKPKKQYVDKIADRAFAINNLSVKQKIDVSFEKDLEKIETQAMEKNKLNNNYYITNFQDNK